MNDADRGEIESASREMFLNIMSSGTPVSAATLKFFDWLVKNKGKKLIIEMPRDRTLANAVCARNIVRAVLAGESALLVSQSENPVVLSLIEKCVRKPDSIRKDKGSWLFKWEGENEASTS